MMLSITNISIYENIKIMQNLLIWWQKLKTNKILYLKTYLQLDYNKWKFNYKKNMIKEYY